MLSQIEVVVGLVAENCVFLDQVTQLFAQFRVRVSPAHENLTLTRLSKLHLQLFTLEGGGSSFSAIGTR